MKAKRKAQDKLAQGIRLVGCQMFLTGSEECPRYLMSTKYRVPMWGIISVDTKGAKFFDANGNRLTHNEASRRLWKYFQQDEHHRRQFNRLVDSTIAIETGQPLPKPDITDVNPPTGFWASVSGRINMIAEGGLWRDRRTSEIGGILPYVAECIATEVWIELDPHALVVADSDSIA